MNRKSIKCQSLQVDIRKTPQIKANTQMKTPNTLTSRKRFQEYCATDMSYMMKSEKVRMAESITLPIL